MRWSNRATSSCLIESTSGKEGAKMAERKAIRLGSVVRTNVSTYSEKEGWAFVNYLDTGNITQDTISEIQRINVGTDKLPSRARRKVQIGNIIYSTVRPNQLHYGLLSLSRTISLCQQDLR